MSFFVLIILTMKERIVIYLTVLGAIALGICKGTELNSNETEAKIFAQKASEIFLNTLDSIETEISYENSPDTDVEALYKNLSMIAMNILEDTNKFDFENFKDKNLKYVFESIRESVGEFIIGKKRTYELFNDIYLLHNLSKTPNIVEYHNGSNELKYNPNLKNIIKLSNDSEELQYYWIEWRKITGAWVKNLQDLINGLQEAAKLRDITTLEFWLQNNNLTEMENLMAAIKPLYVELHAFIRSQLQRKYGDSIIRPDGLIPDHLFEQVLAQAWANNSIIEDIFPYTSLPPVESVLKKRFKAIDLYAIVDTFYEKLGFEIYPFVQIKPNDHDEDDECEPNVFYSTPIIRLEFCANMNFMDFLEAYAQMGNVYYAQQMTGLPAYFLETKGLEHAIGKAVIFSTSTHHNLKAIGMILDFNVTQDVEMNRLLRMAFQKVLNIPLDFVHMKLVADLLSEKVKIEQLNKHYWYLMDKYAGIGPPRDHQSDTFDMPYNFFIDMNENDMSRKFNMEILSYQIYKKLCELSGQYSKGNLHLCDVHGSKNAGDALKKMMRLGSSKPLIEILKTMFPDKPTVMAESLLEYYNPIKNLVGKINKESNVKPGWKTSESSSFE